MLFGVYRGIKHATREPNVARQMHLVARKHLKNWQEYEDWWNLFLGFLCK